MARMKAYVGIRGALFGPRSTWISSPSTRTRIRVERVADDMSHALAAGAVEAPLVMRAGDGLPVEGGLAQRHIRMRTAPAISLELAAALARPGARSCDRLGRGPMPPSLTELAGQIEVHAIGAAFCKIPLTPTRKFRTSRKSPPTESARAPNVANATLSAIGAPHTARSPQLRRAKKKKGRYTAAPIRNPKMRKAAFAAFRRAYR